MTKKRDPFDFEKEVLDDKTELFYQRTRRSETHMRLSLRAGGGRYDPIGKEGRAHMSEHLTGKKTAHFPTEFAISDFDLEHGLEWGARTNWEGIYLLGNSETRKLKYLFFLLKELLVEHQIEEGLLEQEKNVVVQEMDISHKNKNWLKVYLDTNKSLFGNHPLSRMTSPLGTFWSVSSLDINDLKEQRKKFFRAPNLAVVVITSLSQMKIKTMIEEHFTLPDGKNFEYPQPLQTFPQPTENLCTYSIKEITGLSNLEGLSDKIECFAVVPGVEATTNWMTIGHTLKEIFMRKLRYTEIPLIYTLSVGGTRLRDITVLEFSTGAPQNKAMKVKDLFFEGISQFPQQKRLFELVKKQRLRRLKNFQSLSSKVIEEAMEDIVIFDRPKANRELLKEFEDFTFQNAIDWVNRWLNEERILVRIITPQ